jgi:spermidine synthase
MEQRPMAEPMHTQAPEPQGWVDEIHRDVRYGMAATVVEERTSPFQRVTVIDSRAYGKALLLDGCWMTAERQERHYHEAIVHPALCAAERIERVLVIGGGDGGTARECLRHPGVDHLDLVEIDGLVVELCRRHLPSIGGAAWGDPRLHLHVADGIAWAAAAADGSYDVVIVDGSDPAGPAEGLFNRAFFAHCRRLLRPGGVFATQSESPEAFRTVHLDTVRLLRQVFTHADPMYGWVPMYPSGWWSWTFAAPDGPRYLKPQPGRAAAVATGCTIWSPRWQRGAFEAVPAFVERELGTGAAAGAEEDAGARA